MPERRRQKKDGSPEFATWLKSLRSLPESAMRQKVLLQKFKDQKPEVLYAFLCELISGADRRSLPHLLVLQAATEAIANGEGETCIYENLSEVYRLARERNATGVERLLIHARPQRGPLDPTQAPGDPEYSKLTLGQRKFMARGRDRTKLGRLLVDSNPSVIRNLLRNPRLTEQDVVALATRRPNHAEILKEIFRSRFGIRYRVRLSLVCNPYTPTDLALKLLEFLLHRDLGAVATDGSLHPLVKEEAKRIQDARRSSRKKKAETRRENPIES
jgi:hypothetical protein